jgi:hypothetical protein
MYPEKYTHEVIFIKIKVYKTSPAGFNLIIHSRSIAGFNARLQHAQDSMILRPGLQLQPETATINMLDLCDVFNDSCNSSCRDLFDKSTCSVTFFLMKCHTADF